MAQPSEPAWQDTPEFSAFLCFKDAHDAPKSAPVGTVSMPPEETAPEGTDQKPGAVDAPASDPTTDPSSSTAEPEGDLAFLRSVVDHETPEHLFSDGEAVKRGFWFVNKPARFGEGQWLLPKGVVACGAPKLWATGITGEGVKVAVIDSGINRDHPDLAGRVIGERVNLLPDWCGSNFEHGTHVAGVIASNGLLMGVAPDAQLLDFQVLDEFKCTQGDPHGSGVGEAIDRAVAAGADVINLSLAFTRANKPLVDAVQNALRNGVVVCAATGNRHGESIEYPGVIPGVLGCTAADVRLGDKGVEDVEHTAMSSTNIHVDVCGYGDDVLSLGARGSSYKHLSGTSMATPFVAGMAALAVQYLRTYFEKFYYRKLTRAEQGPLVSAMIKSGAQDVGLPGFDPMTGNGFATFLRGGEFTALFDPKTRKSREYRGVEIPYLDFAWSNGGVQTADSALTVETMLKPSALELSFRSSRLEPSVESKPPAPAPPSDPEDSSGVFVAEVPADWFP